MWDLAVPEWELRIKDLHLHLVISVSISISAVRSWKGTWKRGSSLEGEKLRIKLCLHCIMKTILYLYEYSGYCMNCIPIEIDHQSSLKGLVRKSTFTFWKKIQIWLFFIVCMYLPYLCTMVLKWYYTVTVVSKTCCYHHFAFIWVNESRLGPVQNGTSTSV